MPGGVEEVLRIALGGDTDVRALSERFGVRVVGPRLIET
jgi:hypothetical protein